MRLPRTLSRYLVREALLYTALGLVAITIVLVSRNLLRLLDELIAVGFSLQDLRAVLRCLFSMLVAYALPVALLFGVLLSISRMSSDSEIVAMRACGIGTREIVLPLAALGVAVSCATAYLLIDLEHRARRELRALAKSMAARGTMIEAGRFRRIGDRVVYVQTRDRENRLGGVLISDRSDPLRPFTIFAERGRFGLDEGRGELQFELQDGDIHFEPPNGSEQQYHRISFASFDYAFDAERLLGRDFSRLDPRQMSLAELRSVVARSRSGEELSDVRVKDPVQYQLQIHRRFALPLAPLLFVLVAVPLGIRQGRGARSWSALLCVLLAFAYYAILTSSHFAASQRLIPPGPALWLPNAAFGVCAAALLLRTRRPTG